MDINILLNDFESLKVSAVNKLKLINNDVKDVTIGPNSVISPTKITIQTLPQNTNSKPKPSPKGIHKKVDDKNDFNNKNESIPFTKVIIEAEKHRKDQLESNIKSRIASINAGFNSIDANSRLEWVQRQKQRAENERRKEEMMLKVLQDIDKKALDKTEQLHQEYQRQQDERYKKNLELQNREKERKKLIVLVEAIHVQQVHFRTVYQEIVGFIKALNNPSITNRILTTNPNMKILPENMDRLKEKCKSGNISQGDLDRSVALVREVRELKSCIAQQITQVINEERQRMEQAKIQLEKQKNEQLKNESLAQSQSQNTEVQATLAKTPDRVDSTSQNVSSASLKFVCKENLHRYVELQKFLEDYEKKFYNLTSDPRFKQLKFALQKAVNIPLNAISAVNSQHLQDKYNRLSNLLRGKNVEAGGTSVNASQHPEGVFFCMNLLAQKFVLQGDLMISSNPESAHCFASVLVALWIDFPEFGKLVLAHFYREAPYLVPMYPIMLEGQSEQDYYKSLGYRYIDNTVERQDKFLKRMSGIMRLYTATMICRLKRGHQGQVHPHGIANGWAWIASILNLEPKVDITATMIYEFIEVTGNYMKNSYGKQFDKLIIYLTDYMKRIQKIDSGGPMTRLEVLLQKIRQTGQIELPKGRLSEGFW